MQLGDRFIRELESRFEEINQQFDLLQWIDTQVIQPDCSIESAIAEILKRSMANFRAKAASAYVVMDNNLLLFP